MSFKISCNVLLTSVSVEGASPRSSSTLSGKFCWRHDGEMWGEVTGNVFGKELSPSMSKILLRKSASVVELEIIGDFSDPLSNTSSSPASEEEGGSFKHEGDEKAREML